ncbi:hypothetical protein D3C71_1910080 [compost metagenome]
MTTSAVPIAPATCRTVFVTAEPCVFMCFGRVFNPAVLSGIVRKLNPMRKTIVRTTK